jgi:hypothetical protein
MLTLEREYLVVVVVLVVGLVEAAIVVLYSIKRIRAVYRGTV